MCLCVRMCLGNLKCPSAASVRTVIQFFLGILIQRHETNSAIKLEILQMTCYSLEHHLLI